MIDIDYAIKRLRKFNNLTQQELSDKINMSRPTISGYEIGDRSPTLKDLEKIADALNIKVWELIKIGEKK